MKANPRKPASTTNPGQPGPVKPSTASLKGSVILITGASSGIGAACAARFAGEGARLLLAARRLDRLRQMTDPLQLAGADAVLNVPMDVRNHEQVQSTLAALPEEWQSIDVLVNNAGLSRGLQKLHEDRVDNWEEMIDTNVKGLLYVTREVIPGMLARGRGHVINLGSTAAHLAYPNGAVYCATKAAESRLTEGLRQEMLGTPIRVTSVDPGMVETEFSEVRFHGDKQRAAAVYQNITPLTPEDVADAICWAATRPAHVNIAQILMTTIDQANSIMFHRHSS
ncbi:MAG TPA: SDR family NAD(P)-dependent oxidoreductase [Acidobacteriaceae bacterium]|nr:SDR family NAD(P)-dependent oxidoreductase [Acidobacteriaceae bacterium]